MSFGGASLGSASGVVLIDVTQALASLGELNAALAASSGQGGAAFAGATKSANAASGAMVGLGAVTGLVFAGSIKQAADLEFRLSAIQSVTGSTDEQMVGLKQTILDVAQASIFTTQAVAETGQELALLGVTSQQMADGVLKSVVDLSAATETAPQTAANVIASVMNQYGISASETAAVADVFTRASNQSSADVTSLGETFTYAAGTAESLGISYQDLISYSEALNDQNIKGTMAGTSLNQALTAIINPTDEAAEAMATYGIVTKDAAGNFVGMPKILDDLHSSLDGLGEVDRAAVLDTIFGIRGGRAINALLNASTEEAAAAGKSIEDYRKGLDEGATATDQAAQRMDNLTGSVEKLKGALSTLAVQLGGPFLSGLKSLVDGLTALAVAMGSLPPVVAELVAAIGAPIAIFGSLSFLSTLANKSIFRMIPGFEGLAKAASRLALPLAIIVALLEGLKLAHDLNLFGIGDQLDNLADHVKQAVAIIGPAWDLLKALWNTPFGDGQTFTTQIKDLNAFTVAGQKLGLSFNTMRTLRLGFTNLALPIRRVRNLLTDGYKSAKLMSQIFGGAGFATGSKQLEELRARLQRLFGKDVGRDLFQATRRLRAGLKRFGDALGEEFGIKNPFENLSPTALLELFPKLGKAANRLVSGFKRDVMPVIGRGLDIAFRAAAGGLTFLAEHMDQVGTVVRSLLNIAFRPLLTTLDVLKNLLQGDLRGAWDALVEGAQSFGNSLLDLAGVAIDIFQGIDWGGMLSGVLDALLAAASAPPWGAVWDAITLAITETVPAALALGADIALDFAVHVGTVIWGAAKDLGGMIHDFLFGVEDPAGTGGPGGAQGGVPFDTIIDIVAAIGTITWDAAVDLGTALGKVVGENAVPVLKATVNLAVTIGSILWDQVADFGGAIGKAAAETVRPLLKTVVDLAVTIGGVLWDGIAGFGGAVAAFVAQGPRQILHTVVNVAATLGGILWDGIVSIGDAISAIASATGVTPILKSVVNIAATIGGVLWDGAANLAGALVQKIGAGVQALPEAIKVVANAAVTLGGILWDGAANLAGALVQKIGAGAQALPDPIEVLANLAATLGDIVYTGYVSLEDAVKAALDWVGSKTVPVGDLLVNPTAIKLADDIDFSGFFQSIGDAIGAAASATGDAATALGPAMQSIGSAVVDLLMGAINFRASDHQEAVFAIGEAIGKLLGDGLRLAFISPSEMFTGVKTAAEAITSDIALSILGTLVKALTFIPLGTGALAVALANLGLQFTALLGTALAGVAKGTAQELVPDADWSGMADTLTTGLVEGIITAIETSVEGVSNLAEVAGRLKDAVFGLIGDLINEALGIGGDSQEFMDFMGGGGGGGTGAGAKNTAGLGGDGLASALLNGLADTIITSIEGGGALVAGIKDKITEAIKGLIESVIDGLPLPGIVKDALKGLGDIFDDVDQGVADALKSEGLGGKNQRLLRELFDDIVDPEAGPVAEQFLAGWGLGDDNVADILKGARSNAASMRTGIESVGREIASITIPRPKLPELGPVTGRAKLPEIDTQQAPKAVKVPPADLTAYQTSLARIPIMLATAFATVIPIASAGANQIGVVVGTQIGLMVGNVTVLMFAFTTAIGQGMSNALAAATVYATAIYTVVSTIIGTMVGNVAALMTGFTNAVGQGMSDGLAVAVTYANEIYVQVSTAIGMMVGNVLALVGYMASGIVSALQGAVSGAYSAGLAIGAGLAAGITAGIPAVLAAAQAMANAASSATSAALKVASPSRVFKEIGGFVGEGFALGILSAIPAVRGASTMMAEASIPSSTMSAQTAAAAARAGMTAGGDTHNSRSEVRQYNIDMQTDLSKLSTIQDVVNVVNGLKRSIEIATAGGTVRTVV